MTAPSFARLLKTSRLAMPAPRSDAVIADRSIRLTRPDREQLEGKVRQSRAPRSKRSGGDRIQNLATKLSKRLRRKKPKAHKSNAGQPAAKTARSNRPIAFTPYFDARQRAVAKIHYFNHASGGGAALRAHGAYIARGAGPETPQGLEAGNEDPPPARENHPDRENRFYDKASDRVEGAALLEAWGKSDLRHFRIILSAEEGALLRDLHAFTREVMTRAERVLSTDLSWLAVDHHDTDNPHTHIILRGRRANGRDLVLPRDFIKHGFRGLAQDVATEWLGDRTPEQERLSYERDVGRHTPTKLDAVINIYAPDGWVNLKTLEAPNGDPALAQAAKARVQALARMGLAKDEGDGRFRLQPDWRRRLSAMERHLDIRKRVMRDRLARRDVQQHPRGVAKRILDR